MNESITNYFNQLTASRNTIRAKLVELGIATSTSLLSECAAAIAGIAARGSIAATVKEGETYTIPKGYHDGTGTVSGVKGGGSYLLQSKTVTPTKVEQPITPDSGYYGLSDVKIAAIPSNYQDVNSVTAIAENVLASKVFVDKTGAAIAGTMPNIGAVDKTLDTTTLSYTVPKGYHTGAGVVKIIAEEKTVAPNGTVQKCVPSAGRVLSAVNIDPIPLTYIDVTYTNVTPDKVLAGSTVAIPVKDSEGVVQSAEYTDGEMINNGAVDEVLDTTTTLYTIPQGYHNGSGTVKLELEEESIVPTNEAQTVIPEDGKVLSRVTVYPVPDTYVESAEVLAVLASI